MEKERTKRRKRRDEEGQEERNKVLACGGFTSDSMILRGLGGKGEPARWGSCPGPTSIAPQEHKRNTVAFYGVWSPFYGDRLPTPRRVIARDPTVFEREYRASALSIESRVNSRTNSIGQRACGIN